MADTSNLIPNFDNIQIPGAGKSNTSTKEKRDPTVFWVNVGIKRNGKLIQLPMGIPLDKLEARKIPGPNTKNQEFRQIRQAEAELWNQIKLLMSKMKRGQTVELPSFSVEIHMTEEAENTEEIDNSENPFAIGSLGL